MNKKKTHTPNMLVLGENEKKNQVYIQEDNRMKHTLVIGTKGTAKSTGVLPMLARQDIEDKDKKQGATIIVGEKDTALLLYAMAKRANRDVIIVKPSLTDSGKLLLMKSRYDYDELKREVVDFQKAIQKKQIVIVDMEFVRHQERAIRGVAYLISALQEAMVIENESVPTKHFLYVDDAYLYLPFLKGLLYEGKDYGIGCTLFLESRLQLILPEERALVDSTIRNIVLLSGLALEDVKYFVEDIYEKQMPFMRNRALKEFIYSTMDVHGKRTTGHGNFNFIEEQVIQSLRMSIPRYRGGIEREQVGVDMTVEASQPVKAKESTPYAKVNVDVTVAGGAGTLETPVPAIPVSVKPAVKMPAKTLDIKPIRDRVTATAESHSKRHVVIVDDMFDTDEF